MSKGNWRTYMDDERLLMSTQASDHEFMDLMEKKKAKAPVDPQIVWGSKASDHLVGMQVGAVSYLTKEECDALGWYESCAVIEFFDPKGKKKNVWVYASRDDEGNGAGALYTNISDLPIIPVIPCG